MATQSALSTARIQRKPRVAPPILDARRTQDAAVVMILDSDEARRARVGKALATIPADLITAGSHAEAFVEAHKSTVAVAVVDGREAPSAAIDFFRRMQETQPLLVPIIIGIEHDARALLAAVNDIVAFRVLRTNATETELRSAVVGALQFERDRRTRARLDRPWIRGLVDKLEAALPAGTFAHLDETGGELPADLILRGDSEVRYRGGEAL
jgi:FixJ family two-component response regulator